jgi:hypothetical protein
MKYNFEVLVMDSPLTQGFQSLEQFLEVLSQAESLLMERDIEHEMQFVHKNKDFQLIVRPFFEEEKEDDEYVGYILRGGSDDIRILLEMRGKLLSFLSHTLKVNYIKALNDDVSIYLSLQIMPLVQKVEWAMRKLLISYYAYESGPDWWERRAPVALKDKIRSREDQVASLQQLVDTNIELLQLEELGEVLNHPNQYFLDSFVISRIQDIESMEELEELKDELEGQEEHPFEQAFTQKYFAEKWSTLVNIYQKTKRNQLLHPNDLSVAEQAYETLMKMVQDAYKYISGELGDEEGTDPEELSSSATSNDWRLDSSNLGSKAMESDRFSKDDFDDLEPIKRNLKIITEEEIIEELKATEAIVEQTDMRYIGLKNFVTKILANKGYSIGPSYALVNILNDQGLVDIYDYVDPHNPYPVKAVRTNL